MANSWADKWPRVTVERSVTPKHVTFVYPYYDNFTFLRSRQLPQWHAYPDDLLAQTSAIIVDDCSPSRPPIRDAFAYAPLPFPIAVFRIQVDLPWNWLAARNIGVHHAQDGWVLLTDMDHVVPAETLHHIIFGHHDPRIVYAFARREHTGEIISPHSASFLMTRRMFWTIGGYDERLSGHYGTDGEFRRRVSKHAPIQILTDPLVRYEYVADASTTRYQRKLPEDLAAVKKIVAARGKEWTPKVLSFPYEAVSC